MEEGQAVASDDCPWRTSSDATGPGENIRRLFAENFVHCRTIIPLVILDHFFLLRIRGKYILDLRHLLRKMLCLIRSASRQLSFIPRLHCFAYLVPARISVCTLKTPFWWTSVCA